ncbi:MAG: RluA family pseudouridine synthase [Pseudomonadota bacterium]|nr:RluA family pseudouridine synthase [Pseudomonadota bacterium]
MSKTHNFKTAILPALDRQRLDRVLVAAWAEIIPALSRARLQKLIEGGRVTLWGKAVFDSSRKVKTGEIYQLSLPPPEKAEPEAQAIELKVLHEDKDVLVIDKPAGMVVHPAPGNRDRTLVNALLSHCGESLSGIGGVARPGIVHRLDKETSGLMVVAKNDLAHQNLTSQFSDRSLSRVYHAIIWGNPMPGQGSVEGTIGRHPRDRKKMAVTAKGRYALTHYKVLKTYGLASLVECRLTTGRTHQIRVHMAHKKHPVVGDGVYGGKKIHAPGPLAERLRLFPRQALHATELKFLHPRTGRPMHFKSKFPKDIAALLAQLEQK